MSSSWSPCSSPVDSPYLSTPSTPISDWATPPSGPVKLPGIRDLFPDHIQRGSGNPTLASPREASSSSHKSLATLSIPERNAYDDSDAYSSHDSEYSSASSPKEQTAWQHGRYTHPHGRTRAQSVNDSSSWPVHGEHHHPYHDAHLRPRAQTVVEDYNLKYGGGTLRLLGRTATHVCDLCGKRFDRPSSLRTHYNSHTGVTPFKCPWPHCGREFNVKSNMRRHYRKHQGIEQVQQPSLQAHDPHAPSHLMLTPTHQLYAS